MNVIIYQQTSDFLMELLVVIPSRRQQHGQVVLWQFYCFNNTSIVSEFDYDCRLAALTHTWVAIGFKSASSFFSYPHMFILYVDIVANPQFIYLFIITISYQSFIVKVALENNFSTIFVTEKLKTQMCSF